MVYIYNNYYRKNLEHIVHYHKDIHFVVINYLHNFKYQMIKLNNVMMIHGLHIHQEINNIHIIYY